MASGEAGWEWEGGGEEEYWDVGGGKIPWPGWPSNAADDATMMITPRSPSSVEGAVRAMWGRH